MIINLPESKEYENAAKQCLVQAFFVMIGIEKKLVDISKRKKRKFWQYHRGDLNTSLILIYQAIEFLMKAKICTKTPLLLIDMKKTDWPTQPNKKDKDFYDLYTIGGISLVNTFCATFSPEKTSHDFFYFIDDVRVKRNQIIHGISKNQLNNEYILSSILKAFTYFLGKDIWWLSIREMLVNEPIFGLFNKSYEEASLVDELDTIEEIVGRNVLQKHFSYNLHSKRYYCPWCYDALWKGEFELRSKWAFLIPQNNKFSEKIKCINCQRTFSVIRKKCCDCKGNALYKSKAGLMCLSCKSLQ